MHNHTVVKAGDLSRLERAVRLATRAEDARRGQHPENNYTSRTRATARSITPRSTGGFTHRPTSSRGHGEIRSTCSATTAVSSQLRSPREMKTVQQNIEKTGSKQQTSRCDNSRLRPSTAGSTVSDAREQQQKKAGRVKLPRSDRRDGGFGTADHDDGSSDIPSNIKNEWLILETYQQLMTDEKHEEEKKMAQIGVVNCQFDGGASLGNADSRHNISNEARFCDCILLRTPGTRTYECGRPPPFFLLKRSSAVSKTWTNKFSRTWNGQIKRNSKRRSGKRIRGRCSRSTRPIKNG